MDGPVTAENFVEHPTYHASHNTQNRSKGTCRCPRNFDGSECADTQAIIWSLHTAVNPEIGIQIAAEFADRFVNYMELVSKIRRATTIVCDKFEVPKDGGISSGAVLIKAVRSSATYRNVYGTRIGSALAEEMRLEGMVCPWEDDGTRKICGLFEDD